MDNVVRLSSMADGIKKRGVSVLCVLPEMLGLEQYLADKPFPESFQVAVDPDRKLYDSLGAQKKGVSGLLSVSFFKGVFSTKSKGNTDGDWKQLGGEFLVDPVKGLLHSRVQKEFAEYPTVDEMNATLDKFYPAKSDL